jgi:hypothetical protein
MCVSSALWAEHRLHSPEVDKPQSSSLTENLKKPGRSTTQAVGNLPMADFLGVVHTGRMPFGARRSLTVDPCPDCKGVGYVRLGSGELGEPAEPMYHLGYKKCPRCGGSGGLPPDTRAETR